MVHLEHASRQTDHLYARPCVEFALAALTLGWHPVAAAVIATAAVHELLAFASTQLLAFDDDICPCPI